MKTMQYTYNYEPEMYNYILASNILNKKKHEDKIFKELVAGYNCKEIGKKFNRIPFTETYIGEFAENHPIGKYLITTNGHITACVDGYIIDTWDCTNKEIEYIWKIL